ncbi:hypothetical protein XNC1_3694 [Xenorhabdus nematophila ATCC 19061]|uniref:Uncharacterized protein n=1 Tax=Xenorhabdus nematophila (strain ATCC 19061 / DSM 3370 / CCUG 14189 / LMG 1036 / NCIMB 9965 / AN6) TaxID=406817 RepID=D3VAV0_XENNA|nr:hypothetical protein XNC1_3694 [Xenorhabdus nematophila ATCC 19061]CEK24544.1 hypothetical protein XNC2_3550 [Xenorhabdus nematophila AN6/1]
MMAVFADFRWLVAVPKIRGAASRLLTRFFNAPPEGIVAVFPLLAAQRQDTGQLILAVPAGFSYKKPKGVPHTFEADKQPQFIDN